MSHRNARLTFHGRCLLVRRVRSEGMPVAHVARASASPNADRQRGGALSDPPSVREDGRSQAQAYRAGGYQE